MLALALVWLLFFETDRTEETDSGAGERLLSIPSDSLQAIRVVRDGTETTLVRALSGWELRGSGPAGGWQDRAGDRQAEALSQAVCRATALSILAGTATATADTLTAWRPYGVLTSQATRVILTTARGEKHVLWLGLRNPVTERIYARGAGRSGVFTVAAEPWAAVQRLGEFARLRSLWPAFAINEVRSVRIARAGARHPLHFVRARDGTWWARLDSGPDADQGSAVPAQLGVVARGYHEHYADRSRREGRALLWLANPRQLDHLLSLLQQCQVKEVGPAPAALTDRQVAGLAPPTVTVEATLANDSSHLAAFGHYREARDQQVAAARDGRHHILWVSDEPLALLLSPLAAFLQTGVFDLDWSEVDSFALQQSTSRPLVVVQRDGVWQARLPADVPVSDPVRLNQLCGDLVHHLARLPIRAVRPPAAGGVSWQDGRLTRLTLHATCGEGTDLRVDFGLLGRTGEAVAYFPRDGKLLVIDEDLLVTIRALFTTLRL